MREEDKKNGIFWDDEKIVETADNKTEMTSEEIQNAIRQYEQICKEKIRIEFNTKVC